MNERSKKILETLSPTMGLPCRVLSRELGFNVSGGTLGNMRRAGLVSQVDGLWRVTREGRKALEAGCEL